MGKSTKTTEKDKINEKSIDETLSKIYYNLSSVAPLSGYAHLCKEVKKRGIQISEKKVKQWLKKQDVYTLHKQRKLRFQRLKYNPLNIDDVWSIDLADMQNIFGFNRYRYILAIVENFSRYAWCVPIKNKTSEHVINAFESVFRKTTRRPLNILSDRGREFENKKFISYLREHSIHFYTANDPATKASLCERFIRSIKSIIYRYFTHKKTKKFVDVLDQLVTIYNKRPHRSIGCAPADVTESNVLKVWEYVSKKYPKSIFNEKIPKFTVGTYVRISNPKHLFDKGYEKQWSNEIFSVNKVILSYPHTYRISALDGEKINSLFYEDELQEVVLN